MRVAAGITAMKLAPLFMVLAAGIFFVRWQELHWSGWPTAAKLGEGSYLLFFAFQGAEYALTPGAEIRDPARTVPRAVLGAVACIVGLYTALHLVSQGILGRGLAQESTAPLAGVAGQILGVAGRALVLAGTAVSILGTLAGSMVASPRA